MKKFIAALCLALGGCAGSGGLLPTLEYCEHVSYERTGAKAKIEADCTLPVRPGVAG